MFSIISTLWNFFSTGTAKWIVIALSFVTLLTLYFLSRIENANLETTIAIQASNINTLRANITHLEGLNEQYTQALTNKDDEAVKLNTLLSKCYRESQERQQYLDQIQEIMNRPTPSTPDEDTVAEVNYVPVTKYQTKRGLQFVNDQMARITP